MKPINRPNTNLNEEELTRKLFSTIITIVVLIVVIILSTTVFAPAFGSLFKIFGKKDTSSDLVIKPSTPVLTQLPTATKESKLKINGYAQQGTTIKLYVNGPEKASTVTGNDGLFTFENIELIKGRNTIFVKAIDQKQNESDTSSTYIVSMDTDAPKIDIESPKADSTVKNLDKRITIKGKINEKATITINGQIAIVKSDLTFEHLLGVSEGKLEIKIKAIDEAGNEKEEVLKVTYLKASN